MTADHSLEGDAAFVLALRARGVRDTAVLRAMERVARERFVPPRHLAQARRDLALPLPCGQTMTAPTTIAAMLTALGIEAGARVLEVGTGSGYVTALLVRMGAGQVRSLERYATLAEDARARLAEERNRADVVLGDGLAPASAGEGGYDRILVNGALPALPEHLAAALAPGGRLVGVLGAAEAGRLVTIERGAAGIVRRLGPPFRLAPLTPGRARVL